MVKSRHPLKSLLYAASEIEKSIYPVSTSGLVMISLAVHVHPLMRNPRKKYLDISKSEILQARLSHNYRAVGTSQASQAMA